MHPDNELEMPLYKSQKLVRALKIKTVYYGADGNAVVYFEDEKYPNVLVIRKGRPDFQPGWYYVVYENGYYSFSPGDVFEANHTLVPSQGKELSPDEALAVQMTLTYPHMAMSYALEMVAALRREEDVATRVTRSVGLHTATEAPVPLAPSPGKIFRSAPTTWVQRAARRVLSAFKSEPSPGIELDSPCINPIDVTPTTVRFTLQTTPIRQGGVQGCQIDHVVMFAIEALKDLNGEVSCRESALAITNLEIALMWLEKRRRDRIARGVEGTSKA